MQSLLTRAAAFSQLRSTFFSPGHLKPGRYVVNIYPKCLFSSSVNVLSSPNSPSEASPTSQEFAPENSLSTETAPSVDSSELEMGSNSTNSDDSPADSGPKITQTQKPGELGGPKGPEPTRYGDWERRGRVSDF
eukprot:gene9838-2031_t